MDTEDLFTADFKPQPFWWEVAEPRTRNHDLPARTDVCIIGGGYAGLSCALELARTGTPCVVFDAMRIGEGASSRNGGLVTGGIKVALSDIAKRLDAEDREKLEKEAVGTLEFLCGLIDREQIECDFIQVGRFSCAYSRGHYEQMASTTERLAELTGGAAYMVPRGRQREEIGSDFYVGGQVLEKAATIHPGKYVRGLADAASRYSATLVGNTQVTRVQNNGGRWIVTTEHGSLECDEVVLATNAYTGKEVPWFRRRVVPVASFLIATEEIPAELARELVPHARALADSCRVLSYFRLSPDGRRVLWGGRVGTSAMDPRESGRRLHARMRQVWPQLSSTRIGYSWNGNVAFTFDFMPHVGTHRGIHYALGCQGSGVAMQSWLGYQVARGVIEGKSPSAFARMPFTTKPFYGGDPWFLPLVLNWYRLRDRIDRMAA